MKCVCVCVCVCVSVCESVLCVCVLENKTVYTTASTQARVKLWWLPRPPTHRLLSTDIRVSQVQSACRLAPISGPPSFIFSDILVHSIKGEQWPSSSVSSASSSSSSSYPKVSKKFMQPVTGAPPQKSWRWATKEIGIEAFPAICLFTRWLKSAIQLQPEAKLR